MPSDAYLYSCAGCSAHLVSRVRPPKRDGFGEGSYCTKCQAKNRARAEEWGPFQKGDKVKLKMSSGYVWSQYEELTVYSVEGDQVTVFHLGFPQHGKKVLNASELTFKYPWGRS